MCYQDGHGGQYSDASKISYLWIHLFLPVALEDELDTEERWPCNNNQAFLSCESVYTFPKLFQ